MYHLRRRWVPTIIAGAIGLSAAAVMADQPATQPSAADLQAQIQQLKSQVADLKATQQQQSQADETAAVNEVLKESDAQSQLLDSAPMTAGYDAANWRFIIASDDGNFLLHPYGWMQVRYAASYRSSPSNTDSGFEIRRFKLGVDGNLINKDITYKFQIQNTNGPSASAPLGGTLNIEYAWINYMLAHNQYGGDWGLKVGQFKNPVYHEEEAVSDNSLLMVERSLEDNLVGGNALSGPYVQGLNLQYTGAKNPLHIQTLFTDGDNSQNTDFTNVTNAIPPALGTPQTVPQDKFGAAIRTDYKFFGDWADNTDATGKNSGKHDFFAVGAGVNFSQSTSTTTTDTLSAASPPTLVTSATKFSTDQTRFGVDATYMVAQQWILYANGAGFYQNFRGMEPGGHGHRLDGGGLAQLGYMLTPAWELAGRYDVSCADHNFKTGGKDVFNEIGVGVNYFLGDNGSAGNHAKISADVNYLPTGTPAVTGLDYQAQTLGRNEIVGRLQFQLWF
jgi:hypothetical protein